jgi:hypothetical protein
MSPKSKHESSMSPKNQTARAKIKHKSLFGKSAKTKPDLRTVRVRNRDKTYTIVSLFSLGIHVLSNESFMPDL